MIYYFSEQKRPRYFDRQQLSAEDFSLAQNNHLERDRQLSQHLHGWGIVCGATVQQQARLRVAVSRGFGITPSGQDLHIPAIPDLYLGELIAKLCKEPATKCSDDIRNIRPSASPADDDGIVSEAPPKLLYLIARYAERDTQPQPAFPEDCQHVGNRMQYSRTCSGVSIEMLDELSSLHARSAPPCDAIKALITKDNEAEMAQSLLKYFECPDAVTHENDYVVLAELIVSKSSEREERGSRDEGEDSSPFVILAIRYASRKQLLSVQTIQAYLACLCDTPTPTVPPITPSPSPSFTFSPSPSMTFSPSPSMTFSPSPTATLTMRPPFTIDPGITIGPGVTIDPGLTIGPGLTIDPGFTIDPGLTIGPGFTAGPGFTGGPGLGGGLTYPIVDGIIPSEFGGVDIRYYDAMYGAGRSVDDIDLLNAGQKANLKAQGYGSMLDVALASTEKIAEDLSISEVKAVELRDKALNEMRRDEPITISLEEFDIAKGLQTPTNEIDEVGPVRQKRLRQARLNSVAHVANASVETLTKVLDVPTSRAVRIKDSAQNMMKR